MALINPTFIEIWIVSQILSQTKLDINILMKIT